MFTDNLIAALILAALLLLVFRQSLERTKNWGQDNIGYAFSGLGVLFVIFICVLFWGRQEGSAPANLNDVVRTGLLGLGGLGALYGLVIANKRQRAFEKQVKTGQSQLFNDMLGRGAALLAEEKVATRCTGIRVLRNLAQGTHYQWQVD